MTGVGLLLALTLAFAPPPPDAQRVTTGRDFSCALDADGAAWCWGRNDLGQLGRGAADTLPHPKPARVVELPPLVDVAAGRSHVCGAARDGAVWCWGEATAGALGEAAEARPCARRDWGALACMPRPRRVAGVGDAVQVGAGMRWSCARRRDGTVWCWGEDTDPVSPATPRRVTTAREARLGGPDSARAIAMGPRIACLMGRASGLQCWGPSLEAGGATPGRPVMAVGQHGPCLGRDDGRLYCFPRSIPWFSEEVEARVLPGSRRIDSVRVRDLAIGRSHACAIDDAGATWCWGAGGYGQLGDGRRGPDAISARAVRAPMPAARQVAAGHEHSCAVARSGEVHCWGRNLYGAVGHEAVGAVVSRPRRVAIGPR